MNHLREQTVHYTVASVFFLWKNICVYEIKCLNFFIVGITLFFQIQNSLNLVETKTKAPTVLIKPLAGSWREKTWKTFAPKWKSWWTWAKDRAVSRQIRSNDDWPGMPFRLFAVARPKRREDLESIHQNCCQLLAVSGVKLQGNKFGIGRETAMAPEILPRKFSRKFSGRYLEISRSGGFEISSLQSRLERKRWGQGEKITKWSI